MQLVFHCQGYEFNYNLSNGNYTISKNGEEVSAGKVGIQLPSDIKCFDKSNQPVEPPKIDKYEFSSADPNGVDCSSPKAMFKFVIEHQWHLHQIRREANHCVAMLNLEPVEGELRLFEETSSQKTFMS